MTTSHRALVEAIRAGLERLADPSKAPAMQRYMKSSMPYRGVPTPERRRLVRTLIAGHPLSGESAWRGATCALWRRASFREERYAAIDLTGDRRYARHLNTGALDLIEELIVTGAWWDYVDELAIRRVGPILRADRAVVTPTIRRWSRDDDLWLRRSAVICQIGSRAGTDVELLGDVMRSTVDDSDFFIRKGIGWALREHGKTDPAWVVAFVASHPELSPLTRREALRLIAEEAR
ncbi:MAG: DNA alkylation repair protein [Mycobacteriales bacterium]|nr:MAG: DNA alkylation repair protein [Pseudonocardiales bacterium]